VIKAAIARLKTRNPNTKVLVSVGGATYSNWKRLNVKAIRKFVKTFGLDGVDVDFEPTNPCEAAGLVEAWWGKGCSGRKEGG
jgi:chitinase